MWAPCCTHVTPGTLWFLQNTIGWLQSPDCNQTIAFCNIIESIEWPWPCWLKSPYWSNECHTTSLKAIILQVSDYSKEKQLGSTSDRYASDAHGIHWISTEHIAECCFWDKMPPAGQLVSRQCKVKCLNLMDLKQLHFFLISDLGQSLRSQLPNAMSKYESSKLLDSQDQIF